MSSLTPCPPAVNVVPNPPRYNHLLPVHAQSLTPPTCNYPLCAQVGVKVPLVVRLEGTNVDKGRAILKSSGLTIIAAEDLDDAAKKAVAALA